jgi:two-component system chemotaxis sensor kinase CheA
MAKDPYKYFRIEARELLDGLTQGAIDLEKRGVSKEVVNRLLRLAHTLKGAARVVKQREVSEFAHSIEELLTPFRDAAGSFPSDQASRLLKLIDSSSERLKQVFSAPAQEEQAPVRSPEPEGGLTSVRVEIAEMDALLYDLVDTVSFLGVLYRDISALDSIVESANALVTRMASLAGPKEPGNRQVPSAEIHSLAEEVHTALKGSVRSLSAGIDRAHRDLGTIRDRAEDLRLMPARAIFPLMERTARDASEALQKSVIFETEGGDNRLDAHVLLALRDALTHVVRNAVAHGKETE